MKQIKDYTCVELRQIISIKEQIETLLEQLTKLDGAVGDGALETKASSGPRPMSVAARRRISLAQKARWAKQKGTAADSSPPKKRRMSAAGRARIAAAARARWAKIKKAK